MSRSSAAGAALTGTVLLALAVACSSPGKVSPAAHGKFTSVYVSATECDEARIHAVLIDRIGRRSGRTERGRLEKIPGCYSGGGPETDMFNDEYVPRDSTGALLETLLVNSDSGAVSIGAAASSEFHPRYYDFHVSNDAVTPVGLIDQGECELRVEPIAPGAVTLAISAEGVGFSMCKDTTSVVVEPGVPLRWKLSWKSEGDHCVVKMARIEARSSNRPSKP